MKKILIIGNSHSIDAFWYLNHAFISQQPQNEYILGINYHSGCSIDKHIGFFKTDDPQVDYYKNVAGRWTIDKKTTFKTGLFDEKWDTVFLQAAKSDIDDTLNEDGRRELEKIVCDSLGYTPDFMWHTSWPSPNDMYFFSETAPKKVPNGYRDNLIRLYGFDPVRQFTVLTDVAKAHIINDGTYKNAVCTGAAVMNAHIVQGIPQRDIWRDYTHLNDFGQLIAAHAMYTQLTGKPIDEVKIDSIPADCRFKVFTHLGDYTVTEDMKKAIVTAANAALSDRWTVPERR